MRFRWWIGGRETAVFFLCLTVLGIYALFVHPSVTGGEIPLCLFKGVTGLPCPACGTGHGIREICFHGDFEAAFMANPLSVVSIILFLPFSFYLFQELIFGQNILRNCFNWIDSFSNQWPVARWILGLFVLINWFWNFYKW